jgi:hypothetical protein
MCLYSTWVKEHLCSLSEISLPETQNIFNVSVNLVQEIKVCATLLMLLNVLQSTFGKTEVTQVVS